MKDNVGRADRVFRFVLGIGLLSMMYFEPKTYWGLIGIIPLGTAFLGICPVYSIFKITTNKDEDNE